MIGAMFASDYTPLSDLKTLNSWIDEDKQNIEELLNNNDIDRDYDLDTARLGEMIEARYGEWKIFTTDYDEFTKALIRYTKRYIMYYQELLEAYNTQISMLDGKKTVIAYDTNNTRKDSGSDTSASEGSSTDEYNDEANNYDLPRQATSENRPSSKSTDSSSDARTNKLSNTLTYGRQTDTTRGGTVTRTGDADVIDLKKRYMALIQDIYYEFAGRFEPLFVGVFG